MSSIQSTAMARAAAAAAAAAAATAASTSNDSTLWSDAASLLAAASVTQQQASLQVVQDQNQLLNQSSPTSMLLLHQRNQSFGSNNNNSFINQLNRFQSESQQIQASPPTESVGSKIAGSQIDTNFVSAISESNLNEQQAEFGSCNSLGAVNTIISGVTSSSVGIPISNVSSSHLIASESNVLIGSSAPTTNFLSQHLDNINSKFFFYFFK